MTTLTAMPKYEVYKDSGVDWLGEVPVGWSLIKLKRLLKFQTGGTPSTSDSSGYEGDLPWVTIADLDGRFTTKFHRISGRGVKSANIPLTPKGSLLYSFKLSIGQVAFSDRDLYTNEAIASFCDREGINLRYFYYSLPIFLEKNAATNIYGAFLLNQDLIKNAQIINLSIEEQTAIANFLDEKTTKIDEAITIKEKQIELLKERKQIIIQLAVTQGLDPTVPMKDSGVEWIGKIPAHWEVKKIKYFIDILPGYAFKSELYSTNPSDLKLLRGINVSPDKIKWDEVAYWSKEKMAGLENFILKKGDLVIAMDRPWISTGIRVAEIAESDLPCLLLQRVGRIRGINHFSTKYIKLLLSTELFLSYFEPMLTGISVPHISTEQISGFCCPIPPEDEQNKILEHINLESKQFDRIISLLNIEIEKLKEYKTTLINSAVTGKIKVV
jgi:type I restriction enzyme S subunit